MSPELVLKLREFFWERVRKSDVPDACWLWIGPPSSTGYGRLNIYRGWREGHPWVQAHRYSYQLHTGQDPGELCVCHSCDTPMCVAPYHLWPGTMEDNMRDRDAKGRQASGKRNGNSKLTDDQMRSAIERHLAGESYDKLGEELGVWGSTLSVAASGEQWKHLGERVVLTRPQDGERHHNSKLSDTDCDDIRAQRGKISQYALAAKYNVTQTAISKIQRGITRSRPTEHRDLLKT